MPPQSPARASFLIFAKTDSGMAHLTMSGSGDQRDEAAASANMESWQWNIRQNGEGDLSAYFPDQAQ